MSIKQQIREALTSAMKTNDKVTVSTLRLALSAISRMEVSSTRSELSDIEVVAVLQKEAKSRTEAALAFADAGRPDRAACELAEREVLEKFLPRQLSDVEVTDLVKAAIANLGVAGDPKALGSVIKFVRTQATGSLDGALLASIVKRELS